MRRTRGDDGRGESGRDARDDATATSNDTNFQASINITNIGSGYTSTPTITLTSSSTTKIRFVTAAIPCRLGRSTGARAVP